MTEKFAVLLFILLYLAAPLSAQTYGLPGSQPVDPIGYYINQSFWSNKAFTTAMTQSLMNPGSKGRSGSGPSERSTVTGVTAFRPGEAILPNALAALDRDAASRAEMRTLVEGLLSLYRQTAANDGFPANDLAYAFEYFVVNNYQVFNNLLNIYADPEIARIGDPLARLQAVKIKETQKVTLPQERVIYDHFRRTLSENAEIKKMTDRQKQEATELLAVMTGMAYTHYMQGSRNKSEDQMGKGRQAAKNNLERFGVSSDRIRITDGGLEF